MRKVEVCRYNKDWRLMFEIEVEKLAKPIIDIMPIVKEITNVDKYNSCNARDWL